ncbi:Nuclear pore complex protein [Trichinella spiralis]|uniref:Nuclear pore complex protein n=1 Tax=Trichinella spiralis TaxID=6334 RepID=A0ABR3KZ62_TRISP
MTTTRLEISFVQNQINGRSRLLLTGSIPSFCAAAAICIPRLPLLKRRIVDKATVVVVDCCALKLFFFPSSSSIQIRGLVNSNRHIGRPRIFEKVSDGRFH